MSDLPLTPREQKVYDALLLLQKAGKKPSYRSIAHASGVDRTNIGKVLSQLRAKHAVGVPEKLSQIPPPLSDDERENRKRARSKRYQQKNHQRPKQETERKMRRCLVGGEMFMSAGPHEHICPYHKTLNEDHDAGRYSQIHTLGL